MTPKELRIITELLANPYPLPDLLESMEEKLKGIKDKEEYSIYEQIFMCLNYYQRKEINK
jgi:hypothetical protein